MSKKVLENVKMGSGGCSWTAYTASADGVLRGLGWWEENVHKLMGMTGMAFHFIVHRELCPSSVTVYDWLGEHYMMMDRIGVATDCYQVHHSKDLNTFSQAQEMAIKRIKESIDRGAGVVVWAPTPVLEFGIIYGYDDRDGVFLVQECTGKEVDPLLYTNLGKSEVSILFYQIFNAKTDFDPEQTYRQTLRFGLNQWRKEFHISPDYASGKKGYQNFVQALEKGAFNDFGLTYLTAVYADAKNSLAWYLDFLSREYDTKLGEAAGLSGEVAVKFTGMAERVPFGQPVDRKVVPEILGLVKEAEVREEKMMTHIAHWLEV